MLVARRESRLRVISENARFMGARHVTVIAADVVKEDECRRFVYETINIYGRGIYMSHPKYIYIYIYIAMFFCFILLKCSKKKKKKKKTLEGGLEPPTLWLTATRSSQLSYSSFLLRQSVSNY